MSSNLNPGVAPWRRFYVVREGLLIETFLYLIKAFSDETFDGVERRFCVGDSLSFGDLTHQAAAVGFENQQRKAWCDCPHD